MHRLVATTLFSAAGAALLLVATACSDDPDDGPSSETVEACTQYNTVVNEWAISYGAEIGAVEEAAAAGDEERRETSVAVVRELFITTADDLRTQAGATSDQELAEAMTQAADGLAEIGGQIETYEDVTNAPEAMSSGQFAEGGERVSSLCAG
jgi:hypothetical protein